MGFPFLIMLASKKKNIKLIITSTVSIVNNKFAYGLIFVINNDHAQNNKLRPCVIEVNLIESIHGPCIFNGGIF